VRPVNDAKRNVLFAGAAVCLVLVIYALVAGPKSCEGGLTRYALAGLATVVLLPGLPGFMRYRPETGSGVGLRIQLALMGVCAWMIGLLIGGFQILCRLF
jgi:hypothetical protein